MQIFNKETFFKNKITTVNFILAIVVMFIHSENVALYENAHFVVSLFERFISHSLGDLAVPTFFMISSYLFYRNFHLNQLIIKYKRRIKSVLCPYLIWNSLYFIIFYLITFFPIILSFMTTEAFILSPKLIFDAILFHKYNKVFWFMQQLIYFIMLSPLVYFFSKRKWGIIGVVIIFIIGIYCPIFPNNQYGIQINMINYWILGCYFALHKPSQFEEKGAKAFASLSVSVFIILLIIRFALDYIIENPTFLLIFSSLLLLINVPFLWFALSPVIPSHTPWWMQISFFIYATHPLLVDAWKKGSARLLPDTSFFCLANYIFAVIISFMIIIASAKLLLKFSPGLWEILTGGRKPGP